MWAAAALVISWPFLRVSLPWNQLIRYFGGVGGVNGLECGELKRRLRRMNGCGEGVYFSRGVLVGDLKFRSMVVIE